MKAAQSPQAALDGQARRRLWPWLLALVLLPLIGGAIALPIWYHSTADLDAIEAEARRRGLPGSWAEVPGSQGFDPERLAVVDELIALVEALPEQHGHTVEWSVAPDPAVLAWHADLPEGFWERVDALLARIGPGPLILNPISRASIDYMSLFSFELMLFLQLRELSLEAAWIDGAQGASHLQRCVQMAGLIDDHRTSGFHMAGAIRWHVCTALIHLHQAQADANLLEHVRSWAVIDQSAMERVLLGEFLDWMEQLRDPSLLLSYLNLQMLDHLSSILSVRWYRRDHLEFQLELADIAARDLSLTDMAQRLSDRRDHHSSMLRSDRRRKLDICARLINREVAELWRGLIVPSLMAQLALNELGQGPWPEDPFAPGQPLRRHERDGVLIGAWSVGLDGTDDGGDQTRDLRVELRPPWDPPMPRRGRRGANR